MDNLPVSFDECQVYLLQDEGTELDRSPNDAGNWTGGVVGRGELVGSKFGISAATYPSLNIPALTRDKADAIYLSDFWLRFMIPNLPVRVRFLVYSCCVNSGRDGIKWLQKAITDQGYTLVVDSSIGNDTLEAARRADAAQLVVDITKHRLVFLAATRIFREDTEGLVSRVVTDMAIALLPEDAD